MDSRLRSALAAAALATLATAAGAAWASMPRPVRTARSSSVVTSTSGGRRAPSSPRTPTARVSGRSRAREGLVWTTSRTGHPTARGSCTSIRPGRETSSSSSSTPTEPEPGRSSRAPGAAPGGAPAWSPDGTEIAFASGGARYEQIWIVGVDGTNLRRLTGPNVIDADPQWSPDGRRIVFRRIDPYRARKGYALFVVNIDGSGERQLTPWALRAGDHPDWSPDGRRILFRANVEGPRTISSNLYTIRPDGSGLTQLTHARGGTVQHLSAGFSPDGRVDHVLAHAGRRQSGRQRRNVYAMRANGSGRAERDPLGERGTAPPTGAVADPKHATTERTLP